MCRLRFFRRLAFGPFDERRQQINQRRARIREGQENHVLFDKEALDPRAEVPETLWQQIKQHLHSDGFLVALTSIFWRQAWKYGERAFRYCQHDVGHALAALSFSANLLGWKVTWLNAGSDEKTSFAPCWTKPFPATPARLSISD
jgi:nitroreductase